MRRAIGCAVLGWLVVVTAGGCGQPPLHEVGGVVMLDGRPLVGALVTFISDDAEHRFFLARTDAQGRYRLQMGADTSGASVGRYVVRVSTAQEPDGEGQAAATPERVPSRYNVASELRAEITAGRNDIPLDLRSKPAG